MNHGTRQWWQLQLAAKCTWIITSCCQGDDASVTFQPNGIFCFRRSRELTFFKKCLKPSYFSRSPLPTQSSIPFCSDIQFSHDSICPFNDQIRLWEIECCEHSAFYLASETDTFCPVQCCSVFVNSIQDLLIITSGFFFSSAVSITMKLWSFIKPFH